MLHWHSIGFIDPRRPIDLSQKPVPPLPIRPVPPELVERLAARFGVVLGKEVVDMGGYLRSHLAGLGAPPVRGCRGRGGCIVLAGHLIDPMQLPNNGHS
jgi:hypothetical protein